MSIYCKGKILEGKNKGNPCKHPAKENGYCDKHMSTYIFENELEEGNKWCRLFYRGCRIQFDKNNNNVTCTICSTKKREGVKICEFKDCKFKVSPEGENKYCGKHKNQLIVDKAEKENNKICNNISCYNICEGEYLTCTECRQADKKSSDKNRIKNMENFKKLYDEGLSKYRACYNCGNLFEFYFIQNSNKVESTKCKICNSYQVISDLKREDRKRNYKEEKLKHIETGFNELIKSALSRNFKFEIDINDYIKLVVNTKCFYCEYSNQNEVLGIDRVDNTIKSYTIDNTVPCCGDCNISKMALHPAFYIKKAISISKYQESLNSDFSNKLYELWPEYKRKGGNLSYSQYKTSNIKTRNILFDINKYEYTELINGKCYLCGLNTESMGIDRKDNTKGYTSDNCFSCCKYCNQMKLNFNYDNFIKRMKNITKPSPEIWEKIKKIPRKNDQPSTSTS